MSISGLRTKILGITSVNETPKKIAASFAIGIFIGMSPLLGLHTVLGIAAAWLFRLNKIITITGVYITNPWTIIPIYTFSTWFGAKLLGIKDIVPNINWNDMTPVYFINEMEPVLLPFVFGTTFFGILSAVIGYIIVYYAMIKKAAAKKPKFTA